MFLRECVHVQQECVHVQSRISVRCSIGKCYISLFSAHLLLVSSADNLSKQLGHRSGQAKLSCENLRL